MLSGCGPMSFIGMVRFIVMLLWSILRQVILMLRRSRRVSVTVSLTYTSDSTTKESRPDVNLQQSECRKSGERSDMLESTRYQALMERCQIALLKQPRASDGTVLVSSGGFVRCVGIKLVDRLQRWL